MPLGPCEGDRGGAGGEAAYKLECPELTPLTHMPPRNSSLPPGEVTYCLDAGEGGGVGGGAGGGSSPRDQVVAAFSIPTHRSAALLVLQSPDGLWRYTGVATESRTCGHCPTNSGCHLARDTPPLCRESGCAGCPREGVVAVSRAMLPTNVEAGSVFELLIVTSHDLASLRSERERERGWTLPTRGKATNTDLFLEVPGEYSPGLADATGGGTQGRVRRVPGGWLFVSGL